jgi:hypothetical protein
MNLAHDIGRWRVVARVSVPITVRRFAMPCCCHHHCHHPWSYWGWPEPYPPAPRPYAAPPRDAYTQQLEEERNLLMERLRRLEQEVENLRTRGRSPQV